MGTRTGDHEYLRDGPAVIAGREDRGQGGAEGLRHTRQRLLQRCPFDVAVFRCIAELEDQARSSPCFRLGNGAEFGQRQVRARLAG